ncbi:DUF4040 domain-containing protein [Aureimonas fodinaquatilis]|uniref:DUF4040 domain-containing protein n=1 Tax=Aureimonas fodinaquatilis TaxID=2565783 RepID=A0A5B0E0U8_9HYPH|nr:hydrogenase subunit MbhD domain-containing protein [Aureimonas fodinaquatilis]KAA0971922.1 DUF4040 domain-containing protein [Aureimonas fodinaquatilis]
MMLETALDVVIGLMVLCLAAWTIRVRDSLAATAGFIAYGLLLGLVWVRLGSIDIALTEAAIGGGLTGALLLRAATRLRFQTQAPQHETMRPASGLIRAITALCCGSVTLALGALVLNLPDEAATLAPAAAAELARTGVGNPVTAVLLAYRSLDTLLEMIVLLLALIGVWSLATDDAWGGRAGPQFAQSGGPLPFLAQLLPPFTVLIGIALVWIGADAPGGAFQGGTVIAAGWTLVILAGLRPAPRISSRALRAALVAGPVFFIAVGFVGAALWGGFLAYPAGWAKPVIVAVEAMLTLSIAVTLAMLVAGPPLHGEAR